MVNERRSNTPLTVRGRQLRLLLVLAGQLLTNRTKKLEVRLLRVLVERSDESLEGVSAGKWNRTTALT